MARATVTIKDVARKGSVSVALVSRALNGRTVCESIVSASPRRYGSNRS